MEPVVLPPNQPADRFYRGGPQIARFRCLDGAGDAGERVPEDWVASTTTVAGQAALGLTRLPDGRFFRDALNADPEAWLGRNHLSRFGCDTKLLVKLLDAGERLPVHAHPGVRFSAPHLGRAHGKAEAWFILSAGEVFLGLVRDVSSPLLRKLVDEQDTRTLLSLLHRREVRAGDTVYVPPGMLHAIGAGVFLVEVQEPEDLSILLEWRGFAIDGRVDGHLGLGFDTALTGVDTTGRSPEAIEQLFTSGRRGDSILSSGADEFFRLGRYEITGPIEWQPGFAVLVVTDGILRLECETGGTVQLAGGSTAMVPYAAGRTTVSGSGELLAIRPPA